MGSKVIVMLGLLLAMVVLIFTQVSARDLAETSNTDTSTEKLVDGYRSGGHGGHGGSGGHGGHGGGGGNGGGGHGGGGGGHGGGGGGHGGGGHGGGGGGGHGGGGGGCRYGRCRGRCCYAGEPQN